MKTIGILGGMGPEATADMYMSIVEIFQQKYGAKYDKDFPPFFIFSLPIPDVVEKLENEKLLVPMLVKGVKKLEDAGSDFIIIACNTVQYYLTEMRNAVKIPIIGMQEETIKNAKKKGYRKLGLLGTKTTIKTRLFDSEEIEIINPDIEEQEIITKEIMNKLEGKDVRKERLLEMMKGMRKKGTEAIILGCTELPLMIKQEDCEIELLDTTKIIANIAVEKSKAINSEINKVII